MAAGLLDRHVTGVGSVVADAISRSPPAWVDHSDQRKCTLCVAGHPRVCRWERLGLPTFYTWFLLAHCSFWSGHSSACAAQRRQLSPTAQWLAGLLDLVCPLSLLHTEGSRLAISPSLPFLTASLLPSWFWASLFSCLGLWWFYQLSHLLQSGTTPFKAAVVQGSHPAATQGLV